jgi:hypothetical protein
VSHRIPLAISVALGLAVLLASTRAAGPGSGDDDWTDFLVHVAWVIEQDAPEEAGAAGGIIVAGWGAKVDAEGAPIDSVRSMVGFHVSSQDARMLRAARRGRFVLVSRDGMSDYFTSGGRRYRKAASLRRVRPPEWWPDSFELGDVPAKPRRGRGVKGVDVTARFEREEEKAHGHFYRFWLHIGVPDPPARATRAELALRVRARTPKGASIGPVPVALTMKRSKDGTFGQHRSWEITVAPGMEIDPQGTTVEIVSVRFR